ncbi:RNA helicase [Perkinsela sp. CCAP 1560/4]|nr:RNA helicase [Perkinsela sp. CCAP 1560/4]|eukprot:KNH07599.1 RNA helicase [Perkinsela sp. CCAP 1560/4]
MYKVQVPCRLTEDEESHSHQVLNKQIDLLDNSQGSAQFLGIPYFDKNIRHRYNLMQRMRFISQRQQYPAYTHRNDLVSLVQEKAISLVHCTPHPLSSGAATQLPQILSEIDTWSNQRIFVIRSSDMLCEQGAHIVRQEMCIEDSPTVLAYHPFGKTKIQPESKIVFLTLPSLLHVLLSQRDASAIILLEDISDYMTLINIKRDLTEGESHRLSTYVLLFSHISRLLSSANSRVLLCAPAYARERACEWMNVFVSALPVKASLGEITLSVENGEQIVAEWANRAPIKTNHMSMDSIYNHLRSGAAPDHSQGSSTVVLTDNMLLVAKQFRESGDDLGELVFLTNDKQSDAEEAFFEKYDVHSASFFQTKKLQKPVFLVEFPVDYRVLYTLHEMIGPKRIGAVIFIQQTLSEGWNAYSKNTALNTKDASEAAQGFLEEARFHDLLDKDIQCISCWTGEDDKAGAPAVIDESFSSWAVFYSFMSKSLELPETLSEVMWGNTATTPKFSSVFKPIHEELLARQIIDNEGSLTKLGKFVSFLSFVSRDLICLRLIIYSLWYSCPEFGVTLASLMILGQRLRVQNWKETHESALIKSFSTGVLDILRQNGIFNQNYCANSVMIHRCVLISAFYPNIAFPRDNLKEDGTPLANFDVPFQNPLVGSKNAVRLLEKLPETHSAFDACSRRVSSAQQDIAVFSTSLVMIDTRYLIDTTGGYLADLEVFYKQFFDIPEQFFSPFYAFNNYPLHGNSKQNNLYKALSTMLLSCSRLDACGNYPCQWSLFQDQSSKGGNTNNIKRGWVSGVTRVWSEEEEETVNESESMVSHPTASPMTLCYDSSATMNSVVIDGQIRIIFHDSLAYKHFVQLRECYELCMKSSSPNPFSVELLQLIDWTLTKSYQQETEDENTTVCQVWHSLSLERSSQGICLEKPSSIDSSMNSIDDLMINKFTQLVASLQDRSFEGYCREAVTNEEKSLVSGQLRYMLSFLDNASHRFTTYEARLLEVLPNMPSFLGNLIKDSKESRLQSIIFHGLVKFVDELGEEIVHQQRKRLKLELKQAKKTTDKNADGQKAAGVPMKQISLLSDLQDGEGDQRKKMVNTNVELLHATERELEEAAPAVLVEPLPLKKATNLNLPLIIAKALGEILDAKVGPTCLLSEYAHIQVPSKKVAESAMKLGSFMCLGEMVHVHKNCYIVRHKNEQLTKKLDGIRSKNINA